MDQKLALIAALTEIFGPSTVLEHKVTEPAGMDVDHPFAGHAHEVRMAMRDGAATAVVIPSTLNSCYFFNAAGRLTGTLEVRDEYSTYFSGTTGA